MTGDSGLHYDTLVPAPGRTAVDFETRVEALAAELAQVPLPALAGIKRAADAALPYARPELAGNATADFARAWAAEAHWEAMDRAQQRRRG